jgi:uncharacterized protein HemY
MASSSKKRTTMAKLNRERALIERRQMKAARKAARKLAAAEPEADRGESEGVASPGGPPREE